MVKPPLGVPNHMCVHRNSRSELVGMIRAPRDASTLLDFRTQIDVDGKSSTLRPLWCRVGASGGEVIYRNNELDFQR